MAIETNSIEVNIMKAMIVDKVTTKLNELESHIIKIPMGSLFGWQMLSGKGPMVDFKVVPTGNVVAQLDHKFTSAGINQTRHQLMLDVSVTMRAFIPGYSSKIKLETNFLIAETVVVGTVPGSFTQVQDAEEDIISKINDYQAG